MNQWDYHGGELSERNPLTVDREQFPGLGGTFQKAEADGSAYAGDLSAGFPFRICHPFVTRFSSSRPAAIVLNGS